MSNPYLPRALVHTWSETIGNSPENHQAAIARLIRDQRRLAKFVEENAKSLQGATGQVAVYFIGVVLRMYDLAGGRLRNVTWEDIRSCESFVQGAVGSVLPEGDGLVARARAVPRAQPHVLDEALYALFERAPEEGVPPIDPTEALKLYLLLWVAVEALDRNWTPPKGFSGPTEYQFEPVS